MQKLGRLAYGRNLDQFFKNAQISAPRLHAGEAQQRPVLPLPFH